MSTSLLKRFGEDYIINVFKTSNTVEECCEKLQTMPKYVGYYAKELGCEDEYKRIKKNKFNPMKKFPDAYEPRKGGGTILNEPVWIKYVLENKIPCHKAWFILKVLVNTGYKEYKCECCGISEWNGKKLTLQLHHKNGKHDDNSLDNLQILCPNCHTQTENFGSKNTAETKEKNLNE